MTDRYDLFDHAIFIDHIRPGKWRVRVWRNRFDRSGVIDGSAMVGELECLTKLGALHAGRKLARNLRKRGARWPKPDA